MTQAQNAHNSMLIYHIDSSEGEQSQNKQNLSTTSKSDENKKNEVETQISQNRANQNYKQPQIIKVSPVSSKQTPDEIEKNQTLQFSLPQLQSNTNLLTLISSQHKQSVSKKQSSPQHSEYSECDSPVRLRKEKRRKVVSPMKRRARQNNPLLFEEDLQEKNCQDKKQKGFEMSKIPAIGSWIDLQDSQRHFQLERDQLSKIQCQKVIQSSLQTKIKTQPPSKETINYLSRQIQQSQSQEEEVYQNEEGSNMSQQDDWRMYMNEKKKPSSTKVLKELPKQVWVQTTMEELVLNEIPEGLKMVCTFQVESKFLGLSIQYNLRMKETDQIVLSAKKEHFSFLGSVFIISLNPHFITKRRNNSQFIAKLQSNFSGSSYQLIQRITAHQTTNQDTEQDEFDENLSALISFENNLMGYSGIRKMSILKVDRKKLTKRDLAYKTTLDQIIQRKQTSKLMRIQTSRPQYNRVTKRYFMDFGKKVKIPSSKNIILEHVLPLKKSEEKQAQKQSKNTETLNSKAKNQCLLIAKQTESEFIVQINSPLSLLEAFAACLANNDSKILIK